MKRLIKLKAAVLLSALCSIASTSLADQIRVAPNQYIVKLKKEASDKKLSSVMAAQIADRLDDQTVVIEPMGAQTVKNADALESVPYSAQMDQFCKDGIANGLFEHCSPNFLLTTQRLSNDPRLSELWGMTNIEAPSAWDISTGNNGVVVAVIDTGVDYTHSDLAANMWTNTAEVPGNGIDDDANGYIDDVYGMNAINNSGNPFDDQGHGTHCSGTIAGVGNNGIGVAGVAWSAKIMALKFLDANGSGYTSDAVKAINYMVAMKQRGVNVKVSSNSWGGGGFSQALEDSIKAARNAGIVFVAAAGNSNSDNDSLPQYPASYDVDNIVSVAAITQSNQRAGFSCYGAASVDIGAPGDGILSTVPGNQYEMMSGTSMATPHVSGALALLFAREPSLTYTQAIQRLYTSGVDTPALSGLTATGRRLNVNRLIRNQNAPVPTPTPLACEYSVEEIAFEPNRLIESAPLLVSGDDELRTVNLQTPISFFENHIAALGFSTNGVVYMGDHGTPYDYNNGLNAPIKSLAALHTDMLGNAPHGLKVALQNGKVLFFYHSGHYNLPGSPSPTLYSKVWGEIEPNGTIKTFYEFPNGYLGQISSPTVGVTGPLTSSAMTFTRNGQLRNNLGLKFVQRCHGQPVANPTPFPNPLPPMVPTVIPTPVPTAVPTIVPPAAPTAAPSAIVKKIAVKSLLKKGKTSKKIHANNIAQVELQGENSGIVNLLYKVDGKLCSGTKRAVLSNGRGLIKQKIPANAQYVKKIQILSGTAKATAQMNVTKKSNKKLKQKAITQVCKALTR